MDLDMTQAITFSDVDDDAETDKVPVAHLTILNHQTLKNKSYPVYKGKNIVGRQEHSCKICIPVKSLSKKHACIEVVGRSHLLYDMSSCNKSRRGTLFLTPEVRYELKNQDTLVFADVSCRYAIEDIARPSDSGSDTEAMSDVEDRMEDITNTPIPSKSNISLQLDHSDSSNSDILLPTQDFPVKDFDVESPHGFAKEEVLAIDSSPETQANSAYHKEAIYLKNNANEDSNSYTDILAAATQAYVAESDDDTEPEECSTGDPQTIIADTQQTPQQSPHQSHGTPKDLSEESSKPQLNSSLSLTSVMAPVVACEESEGFNVKTSSETALDAKPKEKLDDSFFMSTYKNEIEITNNNFCDENTLPVADPAINTPLVTPTQNIHSKSETTKDKKESDIPSTVLSGDLPSTAVIAPTIPLSSSSSSSSSIMDTIPIGSLQQHTLSVDKNSELPSNTDTPIKDTLPLSGTLMETVILKGDISPKRQSLVTESSKTVTMQAFTETQCVQEEKEEEASTPINKETANSSTTLPARFSPFKGTPNSDLAYEISSPKHTPNLRTPFGISTPKRKLNPGLPVEISSPICIPNEDLPSRISSPKFPHADNTECSDALDATQPYVLESSFTTCNAAIQSPSDKTQPLRQSCGLEMIKDNDNITPDNITPVKSTLSESPVGTPQIKQEHSISSDEEDDKQKCKDILEDGCNTKDVLPTSGSTLFGESGESKGPVEPDTVVPESDTCNVATTEGPVDTVVPESDTCNVATAEGPVDIVVPESDACNVATAEGPVDQPTVSQSSGSVVEKLSDPENAKTEKTNETCDATVEEGEKEEAASVADQGASHVPKDDTPGKSEEPKDSEVSNPVVEESKILAESDNKTGKSSSDTESRDIPEIKSRGKQRNQSETTDCKKPKVRKSIRFDLPEEEVSELEDNVSDKNTRRSSNRSKKSSKGTKARKEDEKMCDNSKVTPVEEKSSQNNKRKSKSSGAKKLKKDQDLNESGMEVDEDFIDEKGFETVKETSEKAEDMSEETQPLEDSRKSKRSLRGKSKQSKGEIIEENSETVEAISEEPKNIRRTGRASRNKSVKEDKEVNEEHMIVSDSSDIPNGRGRRSTRTAKKDVAEDKAKTKNGRKVSLKKSAELSKETEDIPPENSNEESQNMSQVQDEDSASKATSNVNEEDFQDRNSQNQTCRRTRRIKSEEETDSKIPAKRLKRKKISSTEDTESYKDTLSSLDDPNISISSEQVNDTSVSSVMSTDTIPSKTISKRGQSKRQLQQVKEEPSEMPELLTPGKRRNIIRTASQSSNESNTPATPNHLKPNQFTSPRRSKGPKMCVMFTGMTDDRGQRIVTELGGCVVTSYDSCTHLVTDKVRRTVKFLCCLARGIPIISFNWLTQSKIAKMFIDYTPYILSDPDSEKQYNFSLIQSLQLSQSFSPLKGYRIHITKSVKPAAEQMREIIESCKAKFLAKIPTDFKENTVVISCEEDKSCCAKALQAGIPVVQAEFLLTGILQQHLPIEKYPLLEQFIIIFQDSVSDDNQPAVVEKKSKRTKK
ncbi:hypothetical protein Ahia01_000292800 [Argonauta hians]